MKIAQKHIAVTLSDGHLVIVGLLTTARGSALPYGARWLDQASGWWTRPASNEVIFAELQRTFSNPHFTSQGLTVLSYQVVTEAEVLAADRTFRNAWKLEANGKIGHDLAKAKVLAVDYLWAKRQKLMEKLDKELMHAEIRGTAQQVNALKQRKTDLANRPNQIKQAIADATTITELKAITLED